MFCQGCGNEISDEAVVCPKCGRAVLARPSANGDVQVPNHMVGAILSTIFCCLIGGIVAIVYAGQVNTKLAKGDIAGAMEASRKANGWITASVVIGIVAVLLNVLLQIGLASAV